MQSWEYITIRDVPEGVRDQLASRAAFEGTSMHKYLLRELERLAARASVTAWLEQAQKKKQASKTRISSRQILKSRDADRTLNVVVDPQYWWRR